MIKGLRNFLENKVQNIEEIKSIIPGQIGQKRGKSVNFNFRVQRETITGLKCLASYGNTVQEVFIVTNKPDILITKISELKN